MKMKIQRKMAALSLLTLSIVGLFVAGLREQFCTANTTFTNLSQVIGNQLFFCRDGTTYTVSETTYTSGPAVKPAYVSFPDANWPQLGIIEAAELKSKIEEADVMGPNPGAYVRMDRLVKSSILDIDFTLSQMNELVWEGVLQASGGPLTSTSDFMPLGFSGQIRGWLKIQQYDGNNNLRNAFDAYGSMTITAPKMGMDQVKPVIKFNPFFNALNTGVLSL